MSKYGSFNAVMDTIEDPTKNNKKKDTNAGTKKSKLKDILCVSTSLSKNEKDNVYRPWERK